MIHFKLQSRFPKSIQGVVALQSKNGLPRRLRLLAMTIVVLYQQVNDLSSLRALEEGVAIQQFSHFLDWDVGTPSLAMTILC